MPRLTFAIDLAQNEARQVAVAPERIEAFHDPV